MLAPFPCCCCCLGVLASRASLVPLLMMLPGTPPAAGVELAEYGVAAGVRGCCPAIATAGCPASPPGPPAVCPSRILTFVGAAPPGDGADDADAAPAPAWPLGAIMAGGRTSLSLLLLLLRCSAAAWRCCGSSRERASPPCIAHAPRARSAAGQGAPGRASGMHTSPSPTREKTRCAALHCTKEQRMYEWTECQTN